MNDDFYLPPSTTFVRSAIVRMASMIAIRKGDAFNPVRFAEERWGRESTVARTIKSGVAGGNSSNSDWSALGDISESMAAFVDAAQAGSVVGKLQGLRRIPVNRPYVRAQGAATCWWVGESKPTPLSAGAFLRQPPLKGLRLATMIVIASDALEDTSAEGEALIRRTMEDAVRVSLDEAFVDPNNAGSAGVKPAAITHNAPRIAASGDLGEDLGNLVYSFGGSFDSAAFVMSPRLAAQIILKMNGQGLGAGLGLRGGTLAGLPAIVSGAVPFDSDGGMLALIDAAQIVLVDDGAEFASTDEAMVEQDTTPTGATDTPVAASARLVSLWQEGSTGLKVTRALNWEAPYGSVAVLAGAAYGDS